MNTKVKRRQVCGVNLLRKTPKTKNKGFDSKLIDDHVYKFHWLIYYGGDLQSAIDDFAKQIKVEKWEVKIGRNPSAEFFAYRPRKNGAIWISAKEVRNIPLLAHECFHAVSYFMECMDCKLDENSEEFGAYYLEFLLQSILK